MHISISGKPEEIADFLNQMTVKQHKTCKSSKKSDTDSTGYVGYVNKINISELEGRGGNYG